MKNILMISALFFCIGSSGQAFHLPDRLKTTLIARLQSGDSIVYYQCHVEQLEQQLSTASGQTLNTAPQKYSITEKFVITRDSAAFRVRSYVSSMIVLPNRRFSGLKIREKAYWNFKKVREEELSEKDVKILAALEDKGREPTEYEFPITKYNTNQIIIRQRKNFRQLLIEGDYIVSKLIFD
jgi:hypothetical protein